MAGKPQKMRGKYYSRIYIPKGNGKYLEKLVPLNTTNKLEADSRMIIVRDAESAIKIGKRISFPWNNGKKRIEIVQYTLSDAIKDYLHFKKSEQLDPKTIERIENALNHFMSVVGAKYTVTDITIEHFDIFKAYFSNGDRHKPTTININQDKIRAFMRWLHDRSKISAIPKIKNLNVGTVLPKYITDSEWIQILNIDNVVRKHCNYYESFDEHWKKAFYFYRETGCRLSEPFRGELQGNWLIVYIKQKQREIYVPNELLPILNEMRARVGNSINIRDRIQSYSKKFRYACDTLGIDKHFNCLRHTFAVRLYLQTGDIYLVAKALGHSTVKTTEIYMKFDVRRLEQDFPSIIGVYKSNLKKQNRVKSYTDHRIQVELDGAGIVGKV